ncbi:MAG: Fumarate hydratase class I, anaerobic [Betaproteobacteria bacterium ADurb.Bin341]|nr:MAG: Fumarate hydratase class I, anaerobic [Betaproteobacteria bacterium ADurb.Bin341]
MRQYKTTMTAIRQDDFIASITEAFQYISVYHPADFIQAMARAYETEQSPAAKDAIAQILTNSRLCAEGKRPICQDTGIAVVFIKIGMNVKWDAQLSLQEMVDAGVRRAYTDPDNPLRASVLRDPAGERRNSGDNTPAVVHVELVAGDKVDVTCAAKGGGSENKARLAMLNPSDSIADWVVNTVANLGAGWCPPGVLGLGIGGTPEKAMLLAKESLMAPVDMHDLQAKVASGAPLNRLESLRLELFNKINALGIGAQGLGGLTTVLDVKILDAPTHAASLPVALIPNCAAARHVHFELDGSGPAKFEPPRLEDWPHVTWTAESGRRVDLDTLTREEVATWQPGEVLLLNGKLLTGRDAAHQRIADLLAKGESLPVDFKNRVIYYVGPVDPVRDEAVGPAGPTTATRMDKFTRLMLEQTGLLAMIGKAERGPEAIAAIRDHRSAYLVAVGGAAYLVAQAIKKARVVAFADLGMEAMYEFEVVDMPVTVAVDSQGTSLHETGPKEWRIRIGKVPVKSST